MVCILASFTVTGTSACYSTLKVQTKISGDRSRYKAIVMIGREENSQREVKITESVKSYCRTREVERTGSCSQTEFCKACGQRKRDCEGQ